MQSCGKTKFHGNIMPLQSERRVSSVPPSSGGDHSDSQRNEHGPGEPIERFTFQFLLEVRPVFKLKPIFGDQLDDLTAATRPIAATHRTPQAATQMTESVRNCPTF